MARRSANIKLRRFTLAEILWQDPRDPKGELTCRICEAGVSPRKYASHVAKHNGEGWVDLRGTSKEGAAV